MYKYLCKYMDKNVKKHGLKCTNAYANTWTEIYNYNHTVICKYRNVHKLYLREGGR